MHLSGADVDAVLGRLFSPAACIPDGPYARSRSRNLTKPQRQDAGGLGQRAITLEATAPQNSAESQALPPGAVGRPPSVVKPAASVLRGGARGPPPGFEQTAAAVAAAEKALGGLSVHGPVCCLSRTVLQLFFALFRSVPTFSFYVVLSGRQSSADREHLEHTADSSALS